MSTEKELSNINFFICSTYDDLKGHRAAVIDKIKSKAGIINAQEFFGSRDKKPLETCLEEVQKSDVFVMFIGHRLGSLVAATGKSFVECEYDKAIELKLPKLVYLMDEDHPVPFRQVSMGSDAEKLVAFKKRLKSELTIDFFTTPDDLAQKVVNDLQRELPRHGLTIGSETKQNDADETELLLRKFVLLPKVFYGNEVTIEVVFKDYERATKPECAAFSLRYGATLKRQFQAVEPALQKVLRNNLEEIWASDEMAEKLLTAPSNSKIKVTLKTIQGEYSEETPIYAEESYNPFLNLSVALVAYQYTKQYRIVDYKVTHHLKCGLILSTFP